MVLPLGRVIDACGKPGLLKTRSSLPEFSGYMPSISQTNAELFAPRSSLSGRPLGPGLYIVLRMLLTASCDLGVAAEQGEQCGVVVRHVPQVLVRAALVVAGRAGRGDARHERAVLVAPVQQVVG